MKTTGKILNNSIILDENLNFPDGTKVSINIDRLENDALETKPLNALELMKLTPKRRKEVLAGISEQAEDLYNSDEDLVMEDTDDIKDYDENK